MHISWEIIASLFVTGVWGAHPKVFTNLRGWFDKTPIFLLPSLTAKCRRCCQGCFGACCERFAPNKIPGWNYTLDNCTKPCKTILKKRYQSLRLPNPCKTTGDSQNCLWLLRQTTTLDDTSYVYMYINIYRKWIGWCQFKFHESWHLWYQ